MSELSIDDLSYKLPITNGIFVIVLLAYTLPFILLPSNVENYLTCKSDLTLFIPGLDWINFIFSRIVFFDFKNYFFSLILIIIFRSFERIYGSKKFANYMFANFCVSTLLELSIVNLLNYLELTGITHLANGCYSYIFALFINYCKDIPKEKFNFFGISFLSEKLLVYFFGIQIMFTSYSILVASISGLISGIVCRSNAFNVCNVFNLPDRLLNIVIKMLNTILLSNNAPKESIYNGATQSDRRQQYTEIYEQSLLNEQLSFLNQMTPPNHLLTSTSTGASSASSTVSSQSSNNVLSEEELEHNVNQLKAMGFDSEKAKQTLRNTRNDLSRATHLLLDDSG